jgi:hypothetical protein
MHENPFSTLVTLTVGVHKITKHVHEAKLTLSSDFFNNTLNEEWIESTTRMIRLLNCDTEYMDIYIE